MMIVKAVMEQMIKVSMKTSPHPQRDWRTGWSVWAEAWAIMP
jgi:hypothetical protein